MAAYTTFKPFLLTALLALTMPFLATSARPLNPNIIWSNSNLVAMLNLDEESSNCWDSLFQLQSCSGEVVMFFLNGETYLGHSCCEAIRTIEHQCWPALLGNFVRFRHELRLQPTDGRQNIFKGRPNYLDTDH
ncbi:hypothetical protein ACE6H2_026598 [Prunus campanulata]